LFRAAWALCGSREEAEDLVQETFARILARPRVVRGDSDLAYLLRGLRNTYFSSRRTASSRPVEVAADDEWDLPDERPSRQPEAAVEAHELLATISALPDQFRLALIAVDLLGLSYSEAASALKVPEATIATRVYRARDKVAKSVTGSSTPSEESLLVRAIDE
jgi:RNA polymerase sigma-70 factor (ECF subfamily)